ncbi:MAG: ABC transporter ATP-binding protein [Pseudorhodoplanes sp.]|uniref:ABC transporter ATP-binding protein n=1 Tax=Pseudorhodoplanes sp. TaxID=1934341 RepID=UPI003D14DCC3
MLRVDNITASYGVSQILFGVSLEVAVGQAVALLGRNGMGKTTTIRAMMGALRPSSGAIHFEGTRIDRLRDYEICRLGFGYVPEGRRIFKHLTVHEQLVAFGRMRDGKQQCTPDDVYRLFPGLAERRASPGGLLSGGEQQMLAIGRALVTSPKLVILDEATEGLAPLVRERIWSVLSELKSRGLAILVVDKNVADVMALADYAYILEKGRVAWSGAAADLRPDDDAQRRLLAV